MVTINRSPPQLGVVGCRVWRPRLSDNQSVVNVDTEGVCNRLSVPSRVGLHEPVQFSFAQQQLAGGVARGIAGEYQQY